MSGDEATLDLDRRLGRQRYGPELGVVVPCHNGGAFLAACLRSIAAQEFSGTWEVVVVDNASTDDSASVALDHADRFPAFRLVEAMQGSGPAYARNVGARASSARSLVFVDADDEVGPGYLAAMGAALAHSELACATLDGERLNPAHLQRARGAMQVDGPYTHFGGITYLPHAGAGTLGVRRRAFLAVNGFDEGLDVLEDTDLCWRLQLQGATFAFAPDAVLHYRYRADLRGLFSRERKYGRNHPVLYARYLDRGMPRPSVRQQLSGWRHLAGGLRHAGSAWGRARLVSQCGHLLGRVEGSIAERKLFL